MPPRAVPSSLVMTRPVTPAVFRNTSTCDSAFCPTVASSTSSTACGAVGVDLLHHPHDLVQLVHQPALFCRRPAVSTSSTSAPRALRRGAAPRRRGPAASAPGSRAITGAPVRSPQILSCSIAAARKVSPAASITLRPSARNLRGELADGRGLAGAVDADHQDHERLCAASIASGLRDRRQHLLDLGGEDRLHLVGAMPCRSGPRRSLVAIRAGDVDAEIGADQHFLDLLDRCRRSSLRLMTRSVIAAPSRGGGALEAAGAGAATSFACRWMRFFGAVIHVGGRDSGFAWHGKT